MWNAGAGFSAQREPEAAVREAVGQVWAALGSGGSPGGAADGPPDGALLFAGPGHRSEIGRLLAAARDQLGGAQVVGGLAHGVFGAGEQQEGGRALSVLALRGLEIAPLWIPELAGREDLLADELRARLGGDPRAEDLVVLVPDPQALHPDALLQAAADAAGPALVVGAGAGDPVSEAPLVWADGEIEAGALAGCVVRGAAALRVGVSQACRPATGALTVTACQGPWILELDGRPALDVYREALRGPLADDLPRAASFLLAALPRGEVADFAPGSYLVRNIAGFSPERRAFAIPETLKKGAPIALVVREPEAARADLKEMLASLGPEPAGAALYFDCCARGADFWGVPGLEAAYLSQALGNTPLVGMHGSCELGPIAGHPELLTQTAVLTLLDTPRTMVPDLSN